MVRETGVQSQVESYQRLKIMVLDAALRSTQRYEARIEGKSEAVLGIEGSPPLHFSVVAIEKEAFGSPLTMVDNLFTLYNCV